MNSGEVAGRCWCSLLSAMVVVITGCDNEPPSVEMMRRYRISQLSDQQIRDLHKEAQAEFELIKQQAEAEGEVFWAKKHEDQRRCSADVAFRTRNPEACRLPILFDSIGKPSITAKELFEAKLLGMCNYAFTKRDAKKYRCMPP